MSKFGVQDMSRTVSRMCPEHVKWTNGSRVHSILVDCPKCPLDMDVYWTSCGQRVLHSDDADPECSDGGNHVYVFHMHFPQARFLADTVQNVATKEVWVDERGYLITANVSAVKDQATIVTALAFTGSDPYKHQAAASTIVLNKSVLWELGMRMAYDLILSTDYGEEGVQDERVGGWGTLADAACKPPGCTVLAIGTATIIAWSAEGLETPDQVRAFHAHVFDLKDYPFHFNTRSSTSPVWCENRSIARISNLLDGFVAVCDEVRCGYIVNNCSFWDALGIGYAHGPDHTAGPFAAPSVVSLLQNTSWFEADLVAMYPDSLAFALFQPEVYQTLSNIMGSAGELLRQQVGLEMATADASKVLTGAVLESTVLLVALFAMASSRKDLQGWLAKKLFFKFALLVRRLQGFPNDIGLPRAHEVVVEILAMLVVCTLIIAGLVGTPALSLAQDIEVQHSNPDGSSTKVEWLQAKTIDGRGPYTFVAVMVTTVTTVYDRGAFALLCINMAIAAAASLLLCSLALRDLLRELAGNAAGGGGGGGGMDPEAQLLIEQVVGDLFGQLQQQHGLQQQQQQQQGQQQQQQQGKQQQQHGQQQQQHGQQQQQQGQQQQGQQQGQQQQGQQQAGGPSQVPQLQLVSTNLGAHHLVPPGPTSPNPPPTPAAAPPPPPPASAPGGAAAATA